MASRKRIFNIDRNCHYDLGIILLGIENCAITWVEEGVSVRDLTEEEKIEARLRQEAEKSKKAALCEPVPYAELRNTKWVGPKGPESRGLARATVWFFQTALPRKVIPVRQPNQRPATQATLQTKALVLEHIDIVPPEAVNAAIANLETLCQRP